LSIKITIAIKNLHAPIRAYVVLNEPRDQPLPVGEENTGDTIITPPSSLLFLESLLDSSVDVLIPLLGRILNILSDSGAHYLRVAKLAKGESQGTTLLHPYPAGVPRMCGQDAPRSCLDLAYP
jgi:hypothetical protein